ncbi:unnamed protein product [Caenorhabditis brenneri]
MSPPDCTVWHILCGITVFNTIGATIFFVLSFYIKRKSVELEKLLLARLERKETTTTTDSGATGNQQ